MKNKLEYLVNKGLTRSEAVKFMYELSKDMFSSGVNSTFSANSPSDVDEIFESNGLSLDSDTKIHNFLSEMTKKLECHENTIIDTNIWEIDGHIMMVENYDTSCVRISKKYIWNVIKENYSYSGAEVEKVIIDWYTNERLLFDFRVVPSGFKDFNQIRNSDNWEKRIIA